MSMGREARFELLNRESTAPAGAPACILRRSDDG